MQPVPDVAATTSAWSWTGSGTLTEWVVFTVVIGVMLLVDLFVMHRKVHVISAREALLQTGLWIAVALAFGGYVWWASGGPSAALYITGFVVEKALSVDNLFVFLVVFSYFKVDPAHQRRVLTWGILTAVVLRGLLIFVGAALINAFHFVLYIFGAFLLYTAWKLLTASDADVEPEKSPALKLIRRFVPLAPHYDGAKFFTQHGGRWVATPLLAVLAVVETTDVVFALDSVPAIFGITTDPFLIYTSNIFAILGLRALYFALRAMMGKFRYLNVGLAAVLGFVGVKMLLGHWIEAWGVGQFGARWGQLEPAVSLSMVMLLLAASVIASVLNPEPPEASEQDAGAAKLAEH